MGGLPRRHEQSELGRAAVAIAHEVARLGHLNLWFEPQHARTIEEQCQGDLIVTGRWAVEVKADLPAARTATCSCRHTNATQGGQPLPPKGTTA